MKTAALLFPISGIRSSHIQYAGRTSWKTSAKRQILFGASNLWGAVHEIRGIGTQVLKYALSIAWSRNCYKVMLMKGSKQESTLRFYEQAGFVRDEKTGFVARPAS